MSNWNFDIAQAPRGRVVGTIQVTAKGDRRVSVFQPDKLILATKCGKVTASRFLPDEGRWEMLAKGEQPVAWMPWPSHPAAFTHHDKSPVEAG